MGAECAVTCTIDLMEYQGVALLEASEIVLRGEAKRRWKIVEMSEIGVADRELSFRFAAESVRLLLPSAVHAARWLEKVKNPRTRLQKLRLVPGMTVLVDGDVGADFLRELATGFHLYPVGGARYDAVILVLEWIGDLERIPSVLDQLLDGGFVWVLWPKGDKELHHESVVAAGIACSLSQTISVGFNARLTGLRFVRRKGA